MNTLTQQNNLKKLKDPNKIFVWLISIVFFMPNINYYISFFLNSSNSNTSTVPIYIFIYLVVIFAYFKCIFEKPLPLFCLFILAIGYILTYIFWPQNREFLFGDMWDAVYNPFYRIVFLGLPLFFLPSYIEDLEYLYNIFCKFAWINLIIAVYSYVFLIIVKEEYFEYMTFSYNMLFSACLCFADARKRKSKILSVLSIFFLLIIMVVGSRGAMLSVLLFIVLYAFFLHKGKISPGQLLFFVIISVFLLVSVFFFEDILIWLTDFLQSIGFESRSIEKILENNLFEDTARNSIFENVSSAIWNSPLVGNGLYGDRYATMETIYKATYAHNILLEFLCHYGIILGGIICVTYFYYTLSALFLKKNDFMNILYICIFSSTFLKLMVTGSYLSDPNFFLLVGLAITFKKVISKNQTIQE